MTPAMVWEEVQLKLHVLFGCGTGAGGSRFDDCVCSLIDCYVLYIR